MDGKLFCICLTFWLVDSISTAKPPMFLLMVSALMSENQAASDLAAQKNCVIWIWLSDSWDSTILNILLCWSPVGPPTIYPFQSGNVNLKGFVWFANHAFTSSHVILLYPPSLLFPTDVTTPNRPNHARKVPKYTRLTRKKKWANGLGDV